MSALEWADQDEARAARLGGYLAVAYGVRITPMDPYTARRMTLRPPASTAKLASAENARVHRWGPSVRVDFATLEARRVELGISQRAVMRMAGRDHKVWCSLRGGGSCCLQTAEALCDVLGLNIADVALMTGGRP